MISELISTEQRYVTQLEVLLGLFLPSLVGVVPPKELRLLLPEQLESMLAAHKELLARMEERASPSHVFQGIVGDLFGRLCSQTSVSVCKVTATTHAWGNLPALGTIGGPHQVSTIQCRGVHILQVDEFHKASHWHFEKCLY